MMRTDDPTTGVTVAGGQFASIVFVLAVGTFAAMLYYLEAVAWQALGGAVGVVAAVRLGIAVAPPQYRSSVRAAALFTAGAIALWAVFDLQPPMVLYASVSLGVLLGLAVVWGGSHMVGR